MKKFLFAASLLTITTLFAAAQTITATVNKSVTATITGTPTIAPFITASDFELGLVSNPVNIAVKSNVSWKLSTSVANVTSTPLPTGPVIFAPLQPLHISWGVANGTSAEITTWTAFVNSTSTTAANVEAKTGNRGSSSISGNTFTLKYKVTPGFEVDPGSYTIDVTYTVTAQ